MGCHMVVGWLCDKNGEPGKEIDCGKSTSILLHGSERLQFCAAHAADLFEMDAAHLPSFVPVEVQP